MMEAVKKSLSWMAREKRELLNREVLEIIYGYAIDRIACHVCGKIIKSQLGLIGGIYGDQVDRYDEEDGFEIYWVCPECARMESEQVEGVKQGDDTDG